MMSRAHLLDCPNRLQTDEDQQQFVEDNWTILAALAWKGFQEAGRGALLIPTNQLRPAIEGYTAQAIYFPVNDRWPAEVHEVALQSEPEAQFIVVFTQFHRNDDGDWETDGTWNMSLFDARTAHIVDDDESQRRLPTPPEAARIVGREV